MSKYSLPLTQLIHENISIIATFAFSKPHLDRLVTTRLAGEWPYLSKALFDISSQRAAKACIELAVFLRHLDDKEDLSSYFIATTQQPLGTVSKIEGDEDLHFRDLTNKILHASDFGWSFSDPDRPKLICIGGQPERWIRAEIDVIDLALLCGSLAS